MVIENSGNNDLKFKNPEQLLLVVVGFIFWSVGFLDLLGHTSAEPDIFDQYSLPFFGFIILYGFTISIWFILFVSSGALSRFINGVRYIQGKTWLVLALLGGFGLALWIIFEWDRWSRLPGLQFSLFGLILLAAAILVFSGWGDHYKKQWWRSVIAYPLFALIAVEAVIQIVALLGILPGSYAIGGNFAPYERIYYNQEGFRNGFANRYGWYFPDFSLNENNRRILIIGGSYVQALQVLPEQQISASLAELINQNQQETDTQTEVISIGLPGFGPSPFLFELFLSELAMEPGALPVDEIIVLFHLGDDFQSDLSAADPIVYTVDETGAADVHPDDARLRHDLTHYYMRGYLSFQIVEIIRSNYLTPKVINQMVKNWTNQAQATTTTIDDEFNFDRLSGMVVSSFALTEPEHAGIRATSFTTIPNGNNFLFKKNGNDDARQSFTIAGSILETAHEIAAANNITLRVATIPAFPAAFFNQFQADDWQPHIDNYDLFLPEQALVETARAKGIPILQMCQYMVQNKLNVEDIAQLYYSNGQGHFTPLGHNYFAEAMYACFYASATDEICSNE